MKQFWAISILCALLLALFSCREEAVSPRLAEIDALLRTDPDSAYSLLCDSTSTPLAGRRDSAMWRLLTAEARDKTFHDDTVPGEIRRASAYFRDRGDRKNLMRSLFYEGRILQNAGLHGEAVVTLLQSAEQADTTADRLYLGKIYNAIGEIYQSIGDSPQEAEYFEKAWKAYQKTDSAVFIDEAQSCYGLALCRSGRCDAGIRLMTEAYNSAKKLGDTITLHLTLSNLAIGYLWADRNVPGRDCLSIIYANRQSMPMAPEYLDLFLCCLINSGTPKDSIEMVKQELVRFVGNNNLALDYYLQMAPEKVNARLLKRLQESNHTLEEVIRSNLNNRVRIYHEDKIAKHARKIGKFEERRKWMIILSVVIVAFVCTIAYVRLLKRRQRISNLIRSVELLTAQGNHLSQLLEKTNKEKEDLNQENRHLIEKNEMTAEASELILGIFGELNKLYFERYLHEDSDKGRTSLIGLMDEQIRLLREDPTMLKGIETYINAVHGNILEDVYASVKLTPDQRRLVTLQILDFVREAICSIFNITINSYYTRMNRLMARLDISASPRKEELKALIKQKSSKR